jgi:hypothetical protein
MTMALKRSAVRFRLAPPTQVHEYTEKYICSVTAGIGRFEPLRFHRGSNDGRRSSNSGGHYQHSVRGGVFRPSTPRHVAGRLRPWERRPAIRQILFAISFTRARKSPGAKMMEKGMNNCRGFFRLHACSLTHGAGADFQHLHWELSLEIQRWMDRPGALAPRM